HGREYKGNQQSGNEGDRHRHAGLLHHQAKAVGAEAEEHAVAEGRQAGVTDQQIERGRKQAVGGTADHEVEQEFARSEHRQQRQNDKGDQRNQRIAIARRSLVRAGNVEGLLGSQLAHVTSLPNRPDGRDTSTITMKRYISPSVNSGKPSEPKERIKPMSSAPTSAPRIEPMPPITVTMKD